VTEEEWLRSDWPPDMLQQLDGKIPDEEFMRFSVACCRRIWPLLPDRRSRAVVEATEKYLAGEMTANETGQVYLVWEQAYHREEVTDLAGGSTNEAIESVFGVGSGHASQVAMSCFESIAYVAAEHARGRGVQQAEITLHWKVAELTERLMQCQLLRELFGYRPAQ
jgi:hypothetical protein